MTKFGTILQNCGAFFDAPTENFLVLTDFFRFCTAAELVGEVDVLDGQQAEIRVVVQGLGTDHFLPAELALRESFAVTRVQRPLFVALKMLYDISKEPYRGQATVLLAAIMTIISTTTQPPAAMAATIPLIAATVAWR